MAKCDQDAFETVGNPDDLSDSFFSALASLLLEIDGRKQAKLEDEADTTSTCIAIVAPPESVISIAKERAS